MKRTFELVEGTSRKFWHIERDGTQITVSFGRIGTQGQTKIKVFTHEAHAVEEVEKLVKEKVRKGYCETTRSAASAAPASPLREALEAALVEDPDDLASHAAYADYLMEQGDPRGEFIKVQLALEDKNLTRSERARLERRERELLTKHESSWLGELAAGASNFGTHRFARGWLDTIHFGRMGVLRAGALARSPEARLLRELAIASPTYEDWDGDEPAGLPDDLNHDTACLNLLAASPYLGNVRVLRIGEEIDPDFDEAISCHEDGEGAARLIARLPRLEELYLLAHSVEVKEIFALPTLTRLRVLQVYHVDDYPFEVLADNPAMRNLTALLCHPRSYSGYARRIELDQLRALCESVNLPRLTHLRLRLTELGDEGCMMLAESGMLRRLKVLDLRLGSVTDEGAAALANCPDIHHLELLNLSRNALSEEGIARLNEVGVKLIADNQHEEDDYGEWYCVGDIE